MPKNFSRLFIGDKVSSNGVYNLCELQKSINSQEEPPSTNLPIYTFVRDDFILRSLSVSQQTTEPYFTKASNYRLIIGNNRAEKITLEAGRTVRGHFTNYLSDDAYRYALWFILPSGAEKIANANANTSYTLIENEDYIDSKWLENDTPYVVPDGTQYVWVNFYYTYPGAISLSEIDTFELYYQ